MLLPPQLQLARVRCATAADVAILVDTAALAAAIADAAAVDVGIASSSRDDYDG